MSFLSTFSASLNVAIVGASGGIGNAVLEALERDRRVCRIFAFSRTALALQSHNTRHAHIDLQDEASIARAADFAAKESPLDLVVVTTGILHDGVEIQPEKTMRDLDPDMFQRVLAINATGPAMVAKHFLPRLRRDQKTVFAALSARVGSISDNRLGGWTAYRASKAALNMVIKTLAIEQMRTRPESIVVALHPGTVDTNLSRPFATRVPASELFDPEKAADRLLSVIDALDAGDSGGFFAWDGSAIEY